MGIRKIQYYVLLLSVPISLSRTFGCDACTRYTRCLEYIGLRILHSQRPFVGVLLSPSLNKINNEKMIKKRKTLRDKLLFLTKILSIISVALSMWSPLLPLLNHKRRIHSVTIRPETADKATSLSLNLSSNLFNYERILKQIDELDNSLWLPTLIFFLRLSLYAVLLKWRSAGVLVLVCLAGDIQLGALFILNKAIIYMAV